MNILSFDIEEWYIEKHFKGGRKEKYRQYDKLLDWILNTLDKSNSKATFFCVGQLAVEFPEVLKRISDNGHEVGSHSNRHLWINKMTRQEFAEDTRIAVQEIENLIGKKVRSFRAPAFSIGKDNDWAFEVLVENGIEYDCSVFPASRDFGGFPQFTSSVPSLVRKGDYTLKELPICPARLMGKVVPFSGGGYFRLVPLWLQRQLLNRMDYVMFYFHINDLIEQNSKFMTKQEFEKYLDEYDREDEQICLKIVHTYGVMKYAGEIARKMECSGEDVELAELIGLLHDIGKSIDHEVEGSHIQIGVDLCKKYKEGPIVINTVASHHGDVEPESLIACIVQAADAISAARPGARRETLETYTNRLKQLEDITNEFKGVDKSFAIQAGREIRVMVVPEHVTDADMVLLARDIAKQIEAELEYPGQIKVNVIRESRAVDYAK